MRHSGRRRRAVPVPVIRRAPDHVPGADFDDGFVLALGPAEALRDDEGLAQGMGMPGRTRARLESHEAGSDAGWLRRLDDRIDAH